MKTNKYGCTLAVQEHLLSGDPITRLEALVLYGVCNLPQVISGMRKTGLIIKSRALPYIAAVKRVNQFAVLNPPKNLPVREIQLTDYWVSK
jgi:hypothetical protein